MFVVTVTFVVSEQRQSDFLEAVRKQAANSLALETACSRFDVALDPDRPERVFLYELYRDRAAFDAHLASAHFKAFDALVAPWVTDKQVETWELSLA